ncbi:hypothetical protein [Algivirga pacifica]|uniref:Tetratricopeptide repeat-containing protein n=1 Tax=Algivirga pacifica TaxID=1162670 RepID=A0ABP9D5B4_9BACT
MNQKSMFQSVFICFLLFISIKGVAQDNTIALADEYYINGEYEKALEIYKKVAKNKEEIYKIHKNYLDVLIRLEQEKEAKKYLRKLVKAEPTNITYNVDYARFMFMQGDSTKATEQLYAFANELKKEPEQLKHVAHYLIDYNMFDGAEYCYLLGEKHSNENFNFEKADLYSLWGKKDKMIEEYMTALKEDESQKEYVEMALQDRLSKESEYILLEEALIRNVQKHPNQVVYGELLMWYYLQRNEFYKAFFQAKSIDRRKRLEGFKVFEIGKIALNNKDYETAIKIFEYLVERYNNQAVYAGARKMLIRSKELLVKNTFPVDKTKIESLVQDYQKIIDEVGIKSTTADAVRNMALLQAFYLDQRDEAIEVLESLINNRTVHRKLLAQAKLDLGDIYLLKGEPWEASLLYSQVEKSEKETTIGHYAKLKNAKLSYYTGEFKLAKDHLNILKLATSREISNDAMELALLIDDNLNLDTTAAAMQEYARIDLLVFQGRIEEALKGYEQMLITYKGHNLTDEVLWQQSQLLIRMGRFEEALVPLKDIVNFYPYDLWADDANFVLGELYERELSDKEKAMDYYKDQLIKFKGSSYGVEARKRFRYLRGDNIN